MDIYISFFNWILDGLSSGINWVVALLPHSPVQAWSNSVPSNVTLGYITWFIPFPTMLLHFAILLTAIGLYYVYRVVGRWLKMVRS